MRGLTRVVKHQTAPLSRISHFFNNSMVTGLFIQFTNCTFLGGLTGIDQACRNLNTDL